MENQDKKSIEFTKKQFLTLMKIVYLGNWMTNANRDGSLEEPYKKEYEEIESYIFSLARQFGLVEYVDDEDIEKFGRVFPTRKFEEETDVNEICDAYDEGTFWDELAERLGYRDFYKKYTKKDFDKMTQDERFLKLQECIVEWEGELESNGIERLGIVN